MAKVELLSPAGNEEALAAALQNGADAVYVGGRLFGARASAANFDARQLKTAAAACHVHGAKLYLTVNTLIKDSEFDALYAQVREAVEAGVDAALVQDLGAAQMLRQCFPTLPLHASTQMSLHNASGARWAAMQGFTRVVAARECAKAEIAQMAGTGLEVEVFVHGALCSSYSGQCLLSSMIGGRSGNRGRCAQPCRLPYTLMDQTAYWLSPADLCTAGDVPELLRLGIKSLKIEGRLKRPEYVAVVTAAYRRALDAAMEGKPVPDEREALLSIFNRGGFTQGYLMGQNDAGIIAPQRPNHWGVPVGRVLKVVKGRAQLRLTRPLHPGDGLSARGNGEQGIVVGQMDGDWLRVPEGVQAGDALFRTTDAQQLAGAQKSYQGQQRRKPVAARCQLRLGQPARLELGGIRVEGEPVQAAQRNPLQAERVQEQLGKLADTPFLLESLELDMDPGAFLPVSALNALRRAAVEALTASLIQREEPPCLPLPPAPPPQRRTEPPLLIGQSASIDELLRMTDADERYWACRDFRPGPLASGLERLPQGTYLVLPPLLTEAELEEALRAVSACSHLGGLVLGNPAQIGKTSLPWVADAAFNALNSRCAAALREQGALRVTASVEATLAEAEAMAETVPMEILVHGRLPLMTLRHCPLRVRQGLDGQGREHCALGQGGGESGRRTCPAWAGQARLTDRKGEAFALLPYRAATGCRVQLLNAHTLTLHKEIQRLRKPRFAALRVLGGAREVSAYRAALEGRPFTLTIDNPTSGHAFRGVEG